MPYYHDESSRTVYAEPEEPMVFQTLAGRGKARKRVGCSVSVVIEVTRADNWIVPTTGQWAHPVELHFHEHYDHRDSDERAVRWFRAKHMPKRGTVIDAPTYERLKAEYEAIALANKPPADSKP